MNKKLLSDSVDVLKNIRAELQGSVEDRVVTELDEVIQSLEAAQEGNVEVVIKALEVLLLVGNVVEKIPAIAQAIEFLTNLN